MRIPRGAAGDVEPTPFPPAGKSDLDPWVGPSRGVAHPDAPTGGSGSGPSRSPALLGTSGDVHDPFPHPLSPGGRQLDPIQLDDKSDQTKKDTAAQQTPHVVTKDESKRVGGIAVTIKADEFNVANLKEGEADTAMEVNPGATPGVGHSGPEDKTLDNMTDEEKKKFKITSVDGPAPVITATIRTRYKAKTSPTGKSAYGRGTTDKDKEDRNTSLAFHEECHRQDHLNFLKKSKFPTFGGKVGQTVEQWLKEVDKYNEAVFAIQDGSEAETEKNTDEVGKPTKSQFKGGP
jgi:hypothetical protein